MDTGEDVTELTKKTLERMRIAMREGGLPEQAAFYADGHLNHGRRTTREMARGALEDIAQTFPDASLALIRMSVEGEWAMGFYS